MIFNNMEEFLNKSLFLKCLYKYVMRDFFVFKLAVPCRKSHRINVDAHFVLSLGGKYNNITYCRVRIVYTSVADQDPVFLGPPVPDP